MTKRKITFITLLLCLTAIIFQSGCVYYNTFYNAKKAFNDAEKSRLRNKYALNSGGSQNYRTAIEKSLKVIENHPNTKYYDDALYVIGVSYYHTKEYDKADRRLRELIANYPESPFIKDSELYLAKAKLKLRDEEEAMVIFQNIFNSDYDNSLKAEAAMGLGQYYYTNKKIVESQPYFFSVRDSLGDDVEKKIAQLFLADGYFSLYRFDDALSAYLQLVGMNLDKKEKYHALFSASRSAFNLMKIDDGMDYLNTLAENEIFFDSSGVLQLTIAEGYELDGEFESAKEIYLNLSETNNNKRVAAEANYQLGLIAQMDDDNLVLAKEYYDKVTTLYRGNESGKDALQRSSDIGKLETFSRTIQIDSTTTQESIDDAAYTQIQLSQLYWFSLDKPDSAMMELQYVIDSFPTAFDVPTAMIALSQMYKEYKEDTLTSDSILNLVLKNHPRSDKVPDVLELLNLRGSPADTGYAKLYIEKAENFLIDDKNTDSSKFYYQYIVDNFPESDYYLHARFALLWVVEEYEAPGDSSLFFAYNAFIDSFPGTPWANEAERIVRASNREKQRDEITDSLGSDSLSVNLLADNDSNNDDVNQEDEYIDPFVALYVDPKGGKARNLPLDPIETRRIFVYPVEAYRSEWEGEMYFQILLDFSGEVSDYNLMIKSPHEAIDREATESVATMTFDITQIDLELQESWFVYKFVVKIPEKLR